MCLAAGASLITGGNSNPLTQLCRQLHIEMRELAPHAEGNCPLYAQRPPSDAARAAAELRTEGAAALDGDALVGSVLQVWWDGDSVWYTCDVLAYDGAARTHAVRYRDDGLEADESFLHGDTPWRFAADAAADADAGGGGSGGGDSGGGGQIDGELDERVWARYNAVLAHAGTVAKSRGEKAGRTKSGGGGGGGGAASTQSRGATAVAADRAAGARGARGGAGDERRGRRLGAAHARARRRGGGAGAAAWAERGGGGGAGGGGRAHARSVDCERERLQGRVPGEAGAPAPLPGAGMARQPVPVARPLCHRRRGSTRLRARQEPR